MVLSIDLLRKNFVVSTRYCALFFPICPDKTYGVPDERGNSRMQRPTMPTTGRLAKARKYALGGIAAVGLAIVATTVAAPSASAAPRAHGDVDIWIKKSLAVMHKKGIPGSYQGIYHNLMRESAGNPNAINNC